MLKNIKFCEDGIMKLPEKWQKVVEQNSECAVSIKFLVKMKKCVFNPKSKELLGQPNISAVLFESSLFYS